MGGGAACNPGNSDSFLMSYPGDYDKMVFRPRRSSDISNKEILTPGVGEYMVF